MKNKIPFKGWITFEDRLRIEKILFPRNLWSTHTVSVIFGVSGIAIVIATMDESLLFKATCVLTIGGFISGIMWLTERSTMKAKRKFYTKDENIRSGFVSVEFVEIVTDTTKSEIKWDLFTRIEEAEDLVFAAKDKEHYLAFSPHMFCNLEEWEQCKKLLREKKTAIQLGR